MNQNHASDGRAGAIEDLMARVAVGDERAFAQLHQETSRLVFSNVMAVLRDHAQSEEVVQEVYLELWLKVVTYRRGSGTVLGWMTTMARRRAIDRVRASQASRVRDYSYATTNIEPAREVWEPLHSDEMALSLWRALNSLTAVQREAVILAHLMECSTQQIAVRLGISEKAAKSRVHSGIQALRRMQLSDEDFHRRSA